MLGSLQHVEGSDTFCLQTDVGETCRLGRYPSDLAALAYHAARIRAALTTFCDLWNGIDKLNAAAQEHLPNVQWANGKFWPKYLEVSLHRHATCGETSV